MDDPVGAVNVAEEELSFVMEFEIFPYIMDADGAPARDLSPEQSDSLLNRFELALASDGEDLRLAAEERSVWALTARFENWIHEAAAACRPAFDELAREMGIDEVQELDEEDKLLAARVAWLPVAELTVRPLLATLLAAEKLDVSAWSEAAWSALADDGAARYLRLSGLSGEPSRAAFDAVAPAVAAAMPAAPRLLRLFNEYCVIGRASGDILVAHSVRPYFGRVRDQAPSAAWLELDTEEPAVYLAPEPVAATTYDAPQSDWAAAVVAAIGSADQSSPALVRSEAGSFVARQPAIS
jgi:hypothetical protein